MKPRGPRGEVFKRLKTNLSFQKMGAKKLIKIEKKNIVEKGSLLETLLKRFIFILFVITAIGLFIYLNRLQPYYFIDEVFHIPQTLKYCAGKFSEWDLKITTLPGLYLITTAFLAPLDFCNTTSIRSTNLIATFLNFYLVSNLISHLQKVHVPISKNVWINLISSYNIVLFPPLFFWFFLYYTDVFSLTVILAMYFLHLKGYIKSSALLGVISILVRQTNVIWVILLATERGLDLLELKSRAPLSTNLRNTPKHVQWLWNTVKAEVRRGPLSFLKFGMEILTALTPYITVGIIFLAFIVWNGGIVVGDRTAHVPTIHVPQLFYFFSFTFCFAWPYMIPFWKKFVKDLLQHWRISSCILCLMTAIIRSNTLVHPYVLADNRHYVFYVWNYFMGRYTFFKYLIIPLHSFSAYAFYKCLSHVRFLSLVAFFTCICVVLVPQLLLEPRYFIVPYILFRINLRKANLWQISFESMTTLVVNFFQFFIFVNKVFYWEDQEHPQRISW